MTATRSFPNLIAFDDEPFAPDHRGDVRIVGTVYAADRFDGVLIGRVRRDGANAGPNITALVAGSRFREHVQLVLLQGITFAGFNVVDMPLIHRRLDVPVLAVARKRPDWSAIRQALLEHVRGGARKWSLIEQLGPMDAVGNVFVQRVGLTLAEARQVVDQHTAQGHIPEPLRTAHLIAGALGRGESSGRV